MARRKFQILAIIAAVALVATLSLTLITGQDSVDQEGGFLRSLHGVAHHVHGGAHHQQPMAELIDQLELTPDQTRHLAQIHEIIGNLGHGKNAMAELHDQLVAQFGQGRLETDEIRRVVDGHVEQMREVGYAVTDELVALVNGLDARQRQILSEHLQRH